MQLWVSHDDAQVARFGGRVLELPSGHLRHSSQLSEPLPA